MASAIPKQPCFKCHKSGGIATCGGCQRWFCGTHFIEHRHELAVTIDGIGQEHDLLQRDIIQENRAQSLLSHIDDWEQKSIKKVQDVAEKARNDVRESTEHSKQRLQATLRHVTEQLQSSRVLDDYTEVDLDKWIEQLKEIRQLLEKTLPMEISEDDSTQLIICRIHVKQSLATQNKNRELEKEDDVVIISSR